eukprot:1433680-Rhodomonas_salina.2
MGLPGGFDGQNWLTAVERYDPGTDTWSVSHALRNQIQETAFLVQVVLKLRFPVFDFGVDDVYVSIWVSYVHVYMSVHVYGVFTCAYVDAVLTV